MAAETKLGAEMQGGDITYPASVKGSWTIINSNLTSTAETASVLKSPATYAGTAIPARVHPATTRILIRARCATGISAVATSPVVRLYACYGPDASFTPGSGTFLNDGSITFVRIDSGTSTGTGVTLTLTTAAAADKLCDSNYRYSDCYDIAGTDLLGAKWILALTETAASVTGSTTVELVAMALN
mgnify:CR=1 FL=1